MCNWKPIPGLEGFEASDEGHIRNATTQKQLNEHVITTGYLAVSCKGCGHFLVHRLVCMTFHPTEDTSNQVNHINGIKTDNRPENLEWMSLRDNVRDFWNNPIFKDKQAIRKKQMSERMKATRKGRIWITDGSINYQILPEELANYPTFHRGKTNHKKEVV